MAYSRTLQKEVQPQDFLLEFNYRVSNLELGLPGDEPMRAQQRAYKALHAAIAGHVMDYHTIRDEKEHLTEFKIGVYVIPVDEFMGLVHDMARALINAVPPDQQKEVFKWPV